MRRRMQLLIGVLLRVVAPLLLALSAVAADGSVREWNFTVYLDDDAVGYHNFTLTERGDMQTLVSEARFEVKFLFITAYRYEHENRETWQGECLQAITSRTDANGQELTVRGHRQENGFAVHGAGGREETSGCVKTFAYWNPDILQASVLLNSQTGELLPVEVEPLGVETLSIDGSDVQAKHYRLRAKNVELDIWYGQDNRWLALESTVKGGRKLRYELSQES